MGIEKMTLIGHSLGGYLSTAYALKYPVSLEPLVVWLVNANADQVF